MNRALFFVRMRLQQKNDTPLSLNHATLRLEPFREAPGTLEEHLWKRMKWQWPEDETQGDPFLVCWSLTPVMLLRVCFNVAEIVYFWESSIRLG